MVTGDREVTTTLTVSEKDASGAQKWSLGKGKLYDVTHLPCRSARYTPGGGSCQPTNDLELQFPVRPGALQVLGSGLCPKFPGAERPHGLRISETRASTVRGFTAGVVVAGAYGMRYQRSLEPTCSCDLPLPGESMPPQTGCNKQDYAVLFVLAVAA